MIEDLEVLEKYLDGNLSIEDEVDVIERLKYDEQFSRDLEFLKEVKVGFKNIQLKNYKSILEIQEAEIFATKVERRKRYITILFLVILLTIIASYFTLKNKNKIAPLIKMDTTKIEELKNFTVDTIIEFEKNPPYKPAKEKKKLITIKDLLEFPSNPKFADNTVRSGNKIQDTTYTNLVFKSFYSKKYKETLNIIGQRNQSVDAYLKAHCYYNLGYFDESSRLFSALSTTAFFPYSEDARWYLAQSYLNQWPKKYEDGIQVLKEIAADSTHEHQQRAEILLQELSKIN